MNKVFLRKIYPYIDNGRKDIKWRRLTDAEIDSFANAKQKIANCYLDSTRKALFGSNEGREILKKRIWIEANKKPREEASYKFILSPNGKNEIYRVDKNDYFSKYYSLYTRYIDELGLNLLTDKKTYLPCVAMDIAVSKMISKHPKLKDWYLRLYGFPIYENMKCEHNKASRAFEWLTGKKPTTIIAEDGYKDYLKNNQEITIEKLKELAQKEAKDYSFIAMTGKENVKKKVAKWHCLPIEKIDETVHLRDKRTNEEINLDYEKFIKEFKALVGIEWKK